jgi:tRNA A37 methylthiotransferase MiaB
VEKKNATKCYQKYLDVPSCVLVESKVKDSNGVFGYTEKYLKTIIYTSNPHEYHNKFVKVMPTQIKENYLIAYY